MTLKELDLKKSISNNIFNIRTKSLVTVIYNFTGNMDSGGYIGILPRLNGNVLKNYIYQDYSKEGIYSMSASFLLDTNKSETNYLDFIYSCSDYAKNFNGHVSISTCNR